jgi:hypothetical protein
LRRRSEWRIWAEALRKGGWLRCSRTSRAVLAL